MSKLIKSYVFLFLLTLSFSAQEKDMLGWDLSYSSVLKRNNVAQSEWVWKWLEQYESPAGNWITTWQGKPIISSILVEYPAFHAGERTTMWFVRTDDGAHYWELVQAGKQRRNEEDIKPEIYDTLFKTVTTWEQLEPKPPSETPKDEP